MTETKSPDAQDALLRHWPIGPAAELSPMGWTGDAWRVTTARGQRFALKRNPGFDDIAAAARVLDCLAAQGLPVPTLLPTLDGALWVQDGTARVILSPYLPGGQVTDHYAPGAAARAAEFGRGIARLHQPLAKCDGLAAGREWNVTSELRGPIEHVLRTQAPETIWPSVAQLHGDLVQELAVLEPRLPMHIIHGDAHPGNLLFDGRQVCGYLDFDLVVRGARLHDLAYCSTAMLSGDADNPAKRQHWLALVGDLVRGCERVSPLTATEREALCPVQLGIQLDFMAFHLNRGRPRCAAQSRDSALWIQAHREAIEESIS